MKHILFKRLFYCFLAIAIPTYTLQAQSYAYTPASKRFFTNNEMNSLLYKAAKEVFEYNKIPEVVLKNNFETIQPLLLAEIKQGVVKQFKIIEFYNENGIEAAPSTKPFNTVKEQYTKYFTREVEQAFLRNKQLQKFLSFNTSDRITYFTSDVTVQENGKLKVTETITIYNGDGEKGPNENTFAQDNTSTEQGDNNDEIKRGIIRTFPTIYVGKYNLFYNTTFKLLKVERQDEPNEQWQLKHQANGYALYIGKPDYFLPNGLYTYSITYETNHQLKHLQEVDELNWNITGNGWKFRIDSAMCTIHLPKGAKASNYICATGVQGSTEKDCNYTVVDGENGVDIQFKTTRPLLPYQGISAGVDFTKGIVSPPSFIDKIGWLMADNKVVFILLLLIILLIVYYFITWQRVGKDPAPGNIIPEFTPPANLSPAAVGYVYFQEWNNIMVAATIVDLAVKKAIKIDVEKEGFIFKHNAYTILQGSDASPKTAYENFSNEVSSLINEKISKGTYNAALLSFSNKVNTIVEEAYRSDAKGNAQKKGLFSLNSKFTIGPIVISVIAVIICFVMAVRLVDFTPWVMAWLGGGAVCLILVNAFFGKILSAYNPAGRKVKDEIEGFRMYLTTADEQRLNTMNPPDKTIELYEKYLPFAIALDCEVEWGKKFENILDSATLQPNTSSTMYSTFGSNHFSSSFVSSFSSSIASASTPPSSSGSSSSGGGFSSGGGGGGGGGGGW